MRILRSEGHLPIALSHRMAWGSASAFVRALRASDIAAEKLRAWNSRRHASEGGSAIVLEACRKSSWDLEDARATSGQTS
jgi:hypothetical protein